MTSLLRRSTSWDKDRQLIPDEICQHGNRLRDCSLWQCLERKTAIFFRTARQGLR